MSKYQHSNLAIARAAMYVIEKGLEIKKSGEEIIAFNQKICGQEFDIITKIHLIECKNIDWSQYVGERGIYLMYIVHMQVLIAQQNNKIFRFYSKQPIPEKWKKWFDNNNIEAIQD